MLSTLGVKGIGAISRPYIASTFASHNVTASRIVQSHTKTSVYTTQQRHNFITDKIRNVVQDKTSEQQQHKERESFRHLRDYLISCPKFRFREQAVFLESLQSKIGTTDRLIGGQDVKQQEKQLIDKLTLYKAFQPIELLGTMPRSLTAEARTRILVATGLDREILATELQAYEQNKMLHTWLQKRLSEGKTLPESQTEMQALFRTDPPPPSSSQLKMQHKMMAAQRRTFR